MFEFPTAVFPFTNLLLAFMVLFIVIRAAKRGFLLMMLESLSMLVALLIAWLLARPLAMALPIYKMDDGLMMIPLVGSLFQVQINTLIWFVIVFIVISILLALAKPLFEGISKLPVLSFFNGILGLLFGLVQAWIYLLVLTMLLISPLFKNGVEIVENSYLKELNAMSVVVYEKLDVDDFILFKMIGQSEMSDEDRMALISKLKGMGVSDAEASVLSKIILKEELNSEELEVFRNWLGNFSLSSENIEGLIEKFK